MKIKMKMWSPTVQCKVIATLVIITGTLDTSENIWLNPSLRHKVGKNPLIFKQVSAYSLKEKLLHVDQPSKNLLLGAISMDAERFQN